MRTITAGELITQLKQFGPDTEVVTPFIGNIYPVRIKVADADFAQRYKVREGLIVIDIDTRMP